ncbi:MAG: hypothetical protein LC667_19745 [Thioalkalivibrio sp.]|nr:hypothetical protein [Thioalkalivibrio sp.]
MQCTSRHGTGRGSDRAGSGYRNDTRLPAAQQYEWSRSRATARETQGPIRAEDVRFENGAAQEGAAISLPGAQIEQSGDAGQAKTRQGEFVGVGRTLQQVLKRRIESAGEPDTPAG